MIEFDGEQHYYPVDFNGDGMDVAKMRFEDLKKRDAIKNNYCIKNKIVLVRIPYWERGNIQNVLDNYFKKGDLEYVVTKENRQDSLFVL